MNPVGKGARGEREYRQLLENQGWEVYRSSASAGTFDLIALRRGTTGTIECRAIQVKRYGTRKGYGVKALLTGLAKWQGMAWITPQLAERKDDGEWVLTNARRDD